MNKYFKLIDAIETSTAINVARRVNGVTKYGHVRLEPGKQYELDDDIVFLNSLKNAKIQKEHSTEIVNKLKRLGIPYEEKSCMTCGGRVKKISYRIVEIVEVPE